MTAPTRQAVAIALSTARTKVANMPDWFNAINKAAVELEIATNWLFNGSTLVIQSRTQAGKIYRVKHGVCECKAAQNGRVCWHKAAWGLLKRASE